MVNVMQVCAFNLIAAAQECLQEYNANFEPEGNKTASLWDEMQQVPPQLCCLILGSELN